MPWDITRSQDGVLGERQPLEPFSDPFQTCLPCVQRTKSTILKQSQSIEKNTFATPGTVAKYYFRFATAMVEIVPDCEKPSRNDIDNSV